MIKQIKRLLSAALLLLAIVSCSQSTLPRQETGAGGAEQYAPGTSGELRTASIVLPGETEPATVTFEVIDGLAIYQGDIVLGEVKPAGGLDPQAISVSGSDVRWPNGVVPYEVDSGLSSTMVSRINSAIQHWETNTNIDLVERDGDTDYIYFTPGDGCSSGVGREGGKQNIHLASYCSRGNVIHEIGHAVGLWHEQSRNDRDSSIEIVWSNIKEDKKHNFEMHDNDGNDVGDYDHGSVMHYPATAFGKKDSNGNTLTTIRTIPSGISIGQRSGLSAPDLQAIRRLYPEEAMPFVDITDPDVTINVEEGEEVTFGAVVVDEILVPIDDYTISWSYEQYNGVPFIFASSKSGEQVTHSFCDGTYDVVAEASRSGGSIVSATVRVVVNDLSVGSPPAACAPTISIDEPLDGGTYRSGEVIALSATFTDDHPETDAPIHPIIWRDGGPDGRIISQPNAQGSTKLASGRHVIYVAYGSASDSVTIDVVDTANAVPNASIDSPASGSGYSWFDQQDGDLFHEVDFTGSAMDAEDGALSGSSLTWEYRLQGGSSWHSGGTGTNVTLNFPYSSCSWDTWDVKLSATDSGGLHGTDEIEISIQTPGC